MAGLTLVDFRLVLLVAEGLFKMKKGTSGPLTMEKMKAGELCGACHDGKTEIGGVRVFTVAADTSCSRCHKK